LTRKNSKLSITLKEKELECKGKKKPNSSIPKKREKKLEAKKEKKEMFKKLL
jgi:hypothetical protein